MITNKTTHPATWLLIWSLSSGALSLRAAPPETSIRPEYLTVLRNGDAHALRDALDRGAPANGRDATGNTPLMLAAVYGDEACVKLLLERGAQVNATNAAGATPLLRAAFDAAKVRLLLAQGAEVNAPSALGNTPLMLAARPWNSHHAVEMLLAHGADAKATNLWGATALMAAAAGGDEDSVRLLIKHGADVNAQPGANPGAFILGGGRSALMWAAYRGDASVIKRLIDSGANPNDEGFLGTPLAQAAWGDHAATARLLIDRGADVNAMDHGAGYTALHWAASTEGRDPALVKLLLDHGADPNRGGGEHVDAFMDVLQTPLMVARNGERRGTQEPGSRLATPIPSRPRPDERVHAFWPGRGGFAGQ